MADKDVRKSSRTAKVPVRFGFEDSNIVTHQTEPLQRRETASPSVSSRRSGTGSGRSRMSSSITVQQNELEVQLAEEISALEEQLDNKERAVKNLDMEVKIKLDSIQAIKDILDETDSNDIETRQDLKSQLKRLHLGAKTVTQEVKKQRLVLEFEARSIQRKKDILMKKRNLESSILEAAYDSDHNSSQNFSGEQIETRDKAIDNKISEAKSRTEAEACQVEDEKEREALELQLLNVTQNVKKSQADRV